MKHVVGVELPDGNRVNAEDVANALHCRGFVALDDDEDARTVGEVSEKSDSTLG